VTQLISWNRALLKKLPAGQSVKNSSVSYNTKIHYMLFF